MRILFEMYEEWQAEHLIKKLLTHLIGKIALLEIRNCFGNTKSGLGKYIKEETELKLTQNIMSEVLEVITANDQILANREKLSGCVANMTRYQVLILPPLGDQESDPTELVGKPGISGELREHLVELAQKDERLKKVFYDADLTKLSKQDIFDTCLFRYWIQHLWVSVFHDIRMQLQDYHTNVDKDWFKPFVAAMCAWQEYLYR